MQETSCIVPRRCGVIGVRLVRPALLQVSAVTLTQQLQRYTQISGIIGLVIPTLSYVLVSTNPYCAYKSFAFPSVPRLTYLVDGTLSSVHDPAIDLLHNTFAQPLSLVRWKHRDVDDLEEERTVAEDAAHAYSLNWLGKRGFRRCACGLWMNRI